MFSNIFFKISIYLICLLLIIGGLFMLLNPTEYDNSFLNGKQHFSGISLIIIGLIYPITDILIFIKGYKNNNLQ